MRVYLDMCCLKRPFDDQSQARIRLESEAVLALLATVGTSVEIVHSEALDLENDQTPLPHRAAKVRLWLESTSMASAPAEALETRTKELMALGFKNFDALHLASAEVLGANVLSFMRRSASGGRQTPRSGHKDTGDESDRRDAGGIGMSTVLTDPVELRRQGFETLVNGLGWVNAVRFLQQYECSRLDYTRERDQILPDWDAETLLKKLRERTHL